MTNPHRQLAARLTLAILTSFFAASAPAQQPIPRTTILLDPAHGGPDTGAHLPNNIFEKDVTLAFAARLRATLANSGFTLISTRDADPAVTFTTDQRAEIGNHAHPTACLILHATSSGNGIHVIASTLTPPSDSHSNSETPHPPIPWNTAQAASIPQSLGLANDIGLSLQNAKLPVILSRASLRPLDNLTCPAVAIEIAPFTSANSDRIAVTDAAYQQNIATALGAALASWRNRQIAAAAPAAPAAGAQK